MQRGASLLARRQGAHLLNTVDLSNGNGHHLPLHLLRERLPSRVQPLAPNAPGSVEVDHGILLLVDERVEGGLSDVHGVDAVLAVEQNEEPKSKRGRDSAGCLFVCLD